jgi:hypothetical protein
MSVSPSVLADLLLFITNDVDTTGAWKHDSPEVPISLFTDSHNLFSFVQHKRYFTSDITIRFILLLLSKITPWKPFRLQAGVGSFDKC